MRPRISSLTRVGLLTPEGVISKYILGIEFYPRELKAGLDEAAKGKTGSIVDQVLLFCYRYDPATGRYGLVITNILRLASILTLAALSGYVLFMLRREMRQKKEGLPGS